MKPAAKSAAPNPVAVEAVSIPETPQATMTPEAALALLVSHYGIPSASLAERALKAASLAANANSAHGAIRSKLPILSEAEKLGKAGKELVKDSDKVTRDASSLSSDQRKEYNRLTSLIEAAKLLGILAPKAR